MLNLNLSVKEKGMDCIVVLNRKGLGSMTPSDNLDNFEKKNEKLEYKQ